MAVVLEAMENSHGSPSHAVHNPSNSTNSVRIRCQRSKEDLHAKGFILGVICPIKILRKRHTHGKFGLPFPGRFSLNRRQINLPPGRNMCRIGQTAISHVSYNIRAISLVLYSTKVSSDSMGRTLLRKYVLLWSECPTMPG